MRDFDYIYICRGFQENTYLLKLSVVKEFVGYISLIFKANGARPLILFTIARTTVCHTTLYQIVAYQ